MEKKYTQLAKILRKNQTFEENKLWNILRGRRFYNLKFRRQVSIGDYIVDFCCLQKMLIIELAGGGHGELSQAKKDKARDDFLSKLGYKVLRIQNHEFNNNLENILNKIYELTH